MTTGARLSPDESARQLLDRLTFGPRPGDVERVTRMGISHWLDEQLAPQSIDDSGLEHVLAPLPTQHERAFQLIADHPDPTEVQARLVQLTVRQPGTPIAFSAEDSALLRQSQRTAGQLASEILAARLARAVASNRQLQEVMTDFWENHFSVFVGKAPNRFALGDYDRETIRPHALGKFRDLLGAVAHSPMMLYYLDNYQNAVDSLHPNVDEEPIEARRHERLNDPLVALVATLPHRGRRGINENYGRELMELHTLGVDGGYTQADVQEVARALTGWTIEAPQFGGRFVFRPEQHDAGVKTILGHTLPAGRGIQDGEEVLDILARAPATARFIATKIARHLVSDDPPPALIDRCAATFTKSDGDIGETVRCIATSPEFFSRAAYRAKVKTPFELVASAMRAFDAAPDTTSRAVSLVAALGQPLFGHLTPEGWPDRGDAWMNTGAVLNRINLGLRIAAGQVPDVKLAAWPPYARLVALPHDEQVDGVIDALLGGGVSEETRTVLHSGENPMMTTRAVRGGKTPPQLTGLSAIVGLALGSPEFQRR